MSTEEQVKPSEKQPEVQQQVATTPTRVARDNVTGTPTASTTKTVTKQKDPKRVEAGRLLGLRSKEFKLKKDEEGETDRRQAFRRPKGT